MTPKQLTKFVNRVLRIAGSISDDGRFGEDKVFISRVAREAGYKTKKDLEDFKANLLEAQRAGLVILTRADMTPAMNPNDVSQSEMSFRNSTFHFIKAPLKTKKTKKRTPRKPKGYNFRAPIKVDYRQNLPVPEAFLETEKQSVINDLNKAQELIVDPLNEDDYSANYSLEENSDGTIDAEVRVGTLPAALRPFITHKLEALALKLIMPDVWITYVIRYSGQEGIDSPDRRFRGMGEAMANYRAANATNIPLLSETLTAKGENKGILYRLSKKKPRPRPVQVLIRYHWTPDKRQPKRGVPGIGGSMVVKHKPKAKK